MDDHLIYKNTEYAKMMVFVLCCYFQIINCIQNTQMIVMPLKIKSQLSNESINRQLQDTPLRNNLSRMSQTASGLKNLSQERDLKKIEKQRDSSTDKNSHRDLIQSLTSLQQQYGLMRSSNKQNRGSIKRSLVSIKCVPKASITLKPRQQPKNSVQNVRRNNSMDLSGSTFKVVSMGSVCGGRKQKKKGIHISLMDNQQYRRKVR